MSAQVQTLMHCGLYACAGALAAYLVQLVPAPAQVKQLTMVGIGIVTLAIILRAGGLL